ncbi:MAG TPA: acetyl-CoA carboxylase biotin carboxyl carrier protein subunit [Candidatus Enterenecus stercoripullorum]|nr:acetyl-CoA carboxylase biotin carboxyl carrier protein subunit [Candidatus Enterenecus stercoripullorum]
MDKQEIFDLISRFETGTATRMKLTMGDFSLELEKGTGTAAAAGPAPGPEAYAASPVAESSETEGPCITAPLVGTFYIASESGAEPFVRPGQTVKKGQTVGLLEAMKMLSEVQAPCDCVIEEILAQDGVLVSFGEPLVRYRKG